MNPFSLNMFSDDSSSEEDEIAHLFIMTVVFPYLLQSEAEENEARRRRTRERRRRARRPIRPIIDTGSHSQYSSLTSDADSPYNPNNKKRKKNSISPQLNNPQTMESPATKQIFILSGQSNMAGRGGVFRDHHHHNHQRWDGVVPSECGPHSDIHRLDAHFRWEPAREPLHSDIDSKKVCGVGPGMAFANAVRERVGAVGLVPCAVGGTAIKEWARGEHLYESMVKRARESVKSGAEIKGLLWYQGESDTSTQHDADAYQGNMVKLIENVREDLGLPSLPIIQVAIASGDKNYIEKVRKAQLEMEVPNAVCVDAKGLELKDDHLHLTTKAHVQLGQMLAEAYLSHFGSIEANSHPAL